MVQNCSTIADDFRGKVLHTLDPPWKKNLEDCIHEFLQTFPISKLKTVFMNRHSGEKKDISVPGSKLARKF